MLYEVITNPARLPGDDRMDRGGGDHGGASPRPAALGGAVPPRVDPNRRGEAVAAQLPGDDDRITSYNVCYTKLLRTKL